MEFSVKFPDAAREAKWLNVGPEQAPTFTLQRNDEERFITTAGTVRSREQLFCAKLVNEILNLLPHLQRTHNTIFTSPLPQLIFKSKINLDCQQQQHNRPTKQKGQALGECVSRAGKSVGHRRNIFTFEPNFIYLFICVLLLNQLTTTKWPANST